MDAEGALTDQWARALLSGPAGLPALGEQLNAALERGDLRLAAQLQAEAALLWARAGDTSRADEAIGAAFGTASATGDLVVRGIVAWRYVGLLLLLDNIGEAAIQAERLAATLDPDTAPPLRLVGLSAALDVAAATEDWRKVDALAPDLHAAASGDHRVDVLVAQADLAEASAASRLGDADRAARAARRCLLLASEQGFDALTAAALAVLANDDSDPPADTIELTLGIAGRYEAKGDIANAAAAIVTAAKLLHRQGDSANAETLFARAITLTDDTPYLFLNAKARIWNAQLLGPRAARDDLQDAWARLRAIAVDIAHPARRRDLLIGWAGLVDGLLQCVGAVGIDDLEDVVVDAFAVLGADALTTALTSAGRASSPTQQPPGPDLLDRVHDLWHAPTITATTLRDRLGGRHLVAYRVIRASESLLLGWRLSLDGHGAVSLEQFSVTDDAALEVKLIAEHHTQAPSSSRTTWSALGDALLPAWTEPPTELVIAPHGPLWLIPFSALITSQRPLVETTAISVLTSLAMPAGPTTLSISPAVAGIDVSLPGVDAELVALGTDPPPTVTTSATSTQAALDEPGRRTLLLAVHGRGHGHDFHIELDQPIGIDELATWRFPELVIATSCFSGRQSFETWPPSLVTITFLNGARWFLGGIWGLPSESASRTCAAFIHELASGCAPPEALRRAQLDTRQLTPHVVDWAGIILFGWT